MMGHTKEPLHIDGKLTTAPWGDGTSAFNCCNVVSVEHDIVIAVDVEAMTAVRLTDCWNAFEGIDDPAAFMRRVEFVIQDLLAMLDYSAQRDSGIRPAPAFIRGKEFLEELKR